MVTVMGTTHRYTKKSAPIGNRSHEFKCRWLNLLGSLSLRQMFWFDVGRELFISKVLNAVDISPLQSDLASSGEPILRNNVLHSRILFIGIDPNTFDRWHGVYPVENFLEEFAGQALATMCSRYGNPGYGHIGREYAYPRP